uniref:Gephyrin-like n=1 Tax=Hirondellea gigas TaxID=1518452 RepID=A0A2P2HXW3_9CRUS
MAENDDKVCVGILTVSDRCASGETTDASGQNLSRLIADGIIPNAKVEASGCVSDDESSIVEALQHWTDHLQLQLILTTGGTGFSRRDVTPEAVKQVIEREAPGLSTLMTTSSLQVTPLAALSRPVCGIRASTIIITLPGSTKAAHECLSFLAPVLPHAINLLTGRTSEVQLTHSTLQASGAQLPHSTTSHDYRHCSDYSKPHHSHHERSHHNETQHQAHAVTSSIRCHASITTPDSNVDVSNVADRPRKSLYPMISVDDAQQIVFSSAFVKPPVQRRLREASGFVLAVNISSQVSLPPFPASIKDGYAVLSSDGAGMREVLGGVSAGDEEGLGVDGKTIVLASGKCVRINTGAPVPKGADAVVQVEDTELVTSSADEKEELQIRILKAPSVGQDIRPLGSDIGKQDLVLQVGTYLGPTEIGLAASVGVSSLTVYPKPVIGLLSTGNELQSAESGPLKDGCIYDSNLPILRSLLQLHHFDSIEGGAVRDTPHQLKEAISLIFDKGVDVLVTSGSVSMGDKDILRAVLQADFAATIHFAQVFMKPGKPTTFASLTYGGSKRLVLGLPGNPVSATVTANLYLLPLCRKMAGRQNYMPTIIKAKLQNSIRLDPRPEYHRASLSFSPTEDLPLATSTGNQLSSRLLSFTRASALLVLPAASQHSSHTLQEGDVVPAVLLQ